MKTRVVVVDDHHLLREGLCTVLAASMDFEVVGEASDAGNALKIVATTAPDLLVVDLGLPGPGGLAIVRQLRSEGQIFRIVVLTMHIEDFYVADAFAAGVNGYILKSEPPTAIVSALKRVVQGEQYLSAGISRHVVEEAARLRAASSAKKVPGPLVSLSAREREIFDLIVRGLPNKGIAAALFISVKTVETHRAHINRKLAVRSTGEVIRFAAAYGLVSKMDPGAPAKPTNNI